MGKKSNLWICADDKIEAVQFWTTRGNYCIIQTQVPSWRCVHCKNDPTWIVYIQYTVTDQTNAVSPITVDSLKPWAGFNCYYFTLLCSKVKSVQAILQHNISNIHVLNYPALYALDWMPWIFLFGCINMKPLKSISWSLYSIMYISCRFLGHPICKKCFLSFFVKSVFCMWLKLSN